MAVVREVAAVEVTAAVEEVVVTAAVAAVEGAVMVAALPVAMAAAIAASAWVSAAATAPATRAMVMDPRAVRVTLITQATRNRSWDRSQHLPLGGLDTDERVKYVPPTVPPALRPEPDDSE